MADERQVFGDLPNRIHSGPVKFGSDWTGTFIRGDNAMMYASALRSALAVLPAPSGPWKTMEDATLRRLLGLLEASEERAAA